MENNNTHIVYIDESNIIANTGHSVYVGVYIEYLEKNITDKIIFIEKDLKILYTHWVDMTWKIRLKFAEKIRDLNFVCKIIVYQNPIDQERSFEDFLYKLVNSEKGIYRIIADGKKSRRYEDKIRLILKNKGLKFNKIIFMNDKAEPLVRLADFMAGSYRSFLDNKNDKSRHIYNILRGKIKILN